MYCEFNITLAPKYVSFSLTESDHFKLACDVDAMLNVNLNAKEAIRFIEKRITHEWNDEFCEASFQKSRHFADVVNNVFDKPLFYGPNLCPKSN